HRSHFTVQVKNASGNPAPDGTPVLVTAASCGSVINSTCVNTPGGQILGGANAASGSSFRLFFTQAGQVQGDYSSSGGSSIVGQVHAAVIQVLPSDASGNRTSGTPLGTATIALPGAGSSELEVTPDSVPFVFPTVPIGIQVHHLHDNRAQLVPDGTTILLSAAPCASVLFSTCVSSVGGTMTDGGSSSSGAAF